MMVFGREFCGSGPRLRSLAAQFCTLAPQVWDFFPLLAPHRFGKYAPEFLFVEGGRAVAAILRTALLSAVIEP